MPPKRGQGDSFGFPLKALPLLFAILLLLLLCPQQLGAATNSAWVFSCSPSNDLYRVLAASLGQPAPRYASPAEAAAQAPPEAGLLILAEGFPDQMTRIEPAVWETAERKRLRVYVEYPDAVPGLVIGRPVDPGKERVVVTAPFFGEALPSMRILNLNGGRYVPIQGGESLLALARVAGVDTAVFGLKDTASHPVLLVHPRGNMLVAGTRLSQFVTGRAMPTQAWRQVWQVIFQWLQPGSPAPALNWTPTVRPSFGPAEPLPADIESQALRRAADWVVNSRVLRHPAWPTSALEWARTYNTVRERPRLDWPLGDGSLGLLEGYSSTIRADGSQPMRYAVRTDCITETAMLLASDAVCQGRASSARVATNLLQYLFAASGLATGPRADPAQASYGLLGWSLDSPNTYWGDDNARAILSLGACSALLREPRWDEATLRCVLANFRTSGIYGFREECITEDSLRARGWPSYWTGRPVKYSPHFESWLWACFLWAYDQTQFAPLLERSRTGMRMMMAAYPDRWDWCTRSGSIERSRALLPLAWLVRVDDSPEHRRWLRQVAEDLIRLQDASGALREITGDGGQGTASNAEYGTRETTLIQANGDPVCDLLYTCNFALLGLREAAAATGDAWYTAAEDRLARFLCRIQIRSEAHPELDGAWYRAFNFQRWEYWASNADWEWGPWCTETGWTQPWIGGVLGLRQRQTSLWELLRRVNLREPFARCRAQMLPEPVLAQAPSRVLHAALNQPVVLGTAFAPQYSGGGPEALTDGFLGGTDYHDPAWQGYDNAALLATIELGESRPIERVKARFLQHVAVGIFAPVRVELELSSDGKNFERVTAVRPEVPERTPGPLIQEVVLEAAGKPARFARLRAAGLGKIPAWHTGAPGAKAWLFIDEIIVNPKQNPPKP